MTAPRMLVDAGRDLWLGTGCVGCGRPGRVLCAQCDSTLPRAGVPAWPSPSPAGLAAPYAGGDYDGLLKALVNQHKERGLLSLAGPLGRVLAQVVTSAVAAPGQAPAAAPPAQVWLVPVPSRRLVVRRRGHDPLLRTARVAAARLRARGTHARVRPLLVAAAPVRDQAGLAAVERSLNLAGSMRARVTGPAAGVSVVVVDDVLTTGATAREAQRALEVSGVSVAAVAVVAATRRRLGGSPGVSGPSLPFGHRGV